MKILYLHQYFNTPDMSGGTRSYEMARRLVAAGHEVHIITSSRSTGKHQNWYEEIVDGIHVHWLNVPYNNAMKFWQRVKAFFHFALKAGPRAISIGGDVVFATSTPLTIAIPGTVVAWRLRIPMVFEVRDLWPEMPIAMGFLRNPLARMAALWLERFAYSHSAYIVALSQGMADGVAKTGFPRSRISIIPNSADLKLFQYSETGAFRFRNAHPELGNGPIVLYPGTLGKVNGVAYLAYLAHGMLHLRPDVRFVVIGDGAESEVIRQTAENLGILNINFFQYSSMPKRTLVDAFSAASLIISLFLDIPAMRANSANKFFDGLASGTSIAINYQGWQADLLQSSEAGITLPPDPAKAVEPLATFLNSPEKLVKTGMAALDLAQKYFDRDVLAQQLENVLYAAVNERNSK